MMEFIKTNSELRADARFSLTGNWGKAILICVIFSALPGFLNWVPFVGGVAALIFTGPLMLGMVMFFLKQIRGENPSISVLFDGFNRFGSALALYLLSVLFTLLWTLLFVIPGIIASYRYAMAFYILADDPDCGAMEAIRRSGEMMKGFKWKYFLLGLSFIGWFLLSVLTLFIGLLWLIPYMYTSFAAFYENLRQVQNPFTPIDAAPPAAM